MTEAIKEAEDDCRPATVEEIELFEWAAETHRKSLPLVTDSLKQLVTLSTALLGGSAALYNQIPTPQVCKVVFFGLLLGALGLSLFGGFPLTASVLYSEDVRVARDRGIAYRSRCLWWASGLLFMAFAVLAGGLLSVLAGGTPPAIPK